MKRHFAHAYQVTYLVDIVKKYEAKDDVNEYLPLNRNEKINGMIYTNYGIPPLLIPAHEQDIATQKY